MGKIYIKKGPGYFERKKTNNIEYIEVTQSDGSTYIKPNPDYGTFLTDAGGNFIMEEIPYSAKEYYITDGESQYIVSNYEETETEILVNGQTLLKK